MFKRLTIWGLFTLALISISSRQIYKNNDLPTSASHKQCIDSTTYKIIDTTAVYVMTAIDAKLYTVNAKNESVKITALNKGLRFHKAGKVEQMHFQSLKNFEPNNDILSLFGSYCINQKTKYIEFKYRNSQSGKYTHREDLTITGDTIIGYIKKSALGNAHSIFYVKHKIQ